MRSNSINSRMAAQRSHSLTRRWTSGRDMRQRSGRGGKCGPRPPVPFAVLSLSPFPVEIRFRSARSGARIAWAVVSESSHSPHIHGDLLGCFQWDGDPCPSDDCCRLVRQRTLCLDRWLCFFVGTPRPGCCSTCGEPRVPPSPLVRSGFADARRTAHGLLRAHSVCGTLASSLSMLTTPRSSSFFIHLLPGCLSARSHESSVGAVVGACLFLWQLWSRCPDGVARRG